MAGTNLNDTSIFKLDDIADTDQIAIGRPGSNFPTVITGATLKAFIAAAIAAGVADKLAAVAHDDSLTGSGTAADPLSAAGLFVEAPDLDTALALSALDTVPLYLVPKEET